MTTLELPKVSNYGNYSSDNYGAHTLRVDFLNITLFYSYETIVAYRDNTDGLVISKNIWGTTTGKHLNWINDNKKERVEHDKFVAMLRDALTRVNATELA